MSSLSNVMLMFKNSMGDGITWTARTMPVNTGWIDVTYGNGKFVTIGYNTSVITSP